MRLDGETALVTGASRGIGEAIARMLAGAGASVVGTATTPEGVERIEGALAGFGAGRGAVLDVRDEGSVSALFRTLEGEGRVPGIVVNNAGITRDGLLVRMDAADWDAVIDTNLTALYRICRLCVRPLMKARRGRIINIGSVVGETGNAGQVNYCAAKAGLVGFTRALARELGPRGITVNAVAPGFIDTDMTRGLSGARRDALLASVPLGRLGRPDDVAAAVLFLASPAAAYVTGEILHVNGGLHMG
jgi:3-oxoacyl-[acyl-carrier protein] reductase